MLHTVLRQTQQEMTPQNDIIPFPVKTDISHGKRLVPSQQQGSNHGNVQL